MLLTNTKKFFHRTIQSFKSLFSGVQYEKLPKTPPPITDPYPPHTTMMTSTQTSFKNQEMDKFYRDYNEKWLPTDQERAKNHEKKEIIKSSPSPSSSSKTKQERGGHDQKGNFINYSTPTPAKNFQIRTRKDCSTNYSHNNQGKNNFYGGNKRSQLQNNSDPEGNTREARSFVVAQKLKELEMMDVSNIDHVLDIEEVLHYYSRLTCPAYLELVDKFFMEIYAEFFAPLVSPLSAHHPRPRLHSLRS
ncbi:hypothetical protein Tsubulata_034351 [Turnera subulata]|uniref:OVATE domain-containing protein n=1 Tax=Turnera subulata TaxID=218843 RepID=A0A9Q0FMG0_9ROSI|nr:hypothetical protein Tsubulata_034351 [Turnera subulata]